MQFGKLIFNSPNFAANIQGYTEFVSSYLYLLKRQLLGWSPEQQGGDMRAQPIHPPLRMAEVSFLKKPKSSHLNYRCWP